jgi:hypothetical protein
VRTAPRKTTDGHQSAIAVPLLSAHAAKCRWWLDIPRHVVSGVAPEGGVACAWGHIGCGRRRRTGPRPIHGKRRLPASASTPTDKVRISEGQRRGWAGGAVRVRSQLRCQPPAQHRQRLGQASQRRCRVGPVELFAQRLELGFGDQRGCDVVYGAHRSVTVEARSSGSLWLRSADLVQLEATDHLVVAQLPRRHAGLCRRRC